MYIRKVSNKPEYYFSSIDNRKDKDSLVCFYCGKLIMGENGKYGNHRNKDILDTYMNHDKFCIEWHGFDPHDIVLHPLCAEELAMHLIKDVRSGELDKYLKTCK